MATFLPLGISLNAWWPPGNQHILTCYLRMKISGLQNLKYNILTTMWKTGDFSSIIMPAGRDQGSNKLVALSSLISMVSGVCGQSCPGLRGRPNLCCPRRQIRDKRQVLISVGNLSHRWEPRGEAVWLC